MHRKLASILAFFLLCGLSSAQGFDVFQDPDNSGNPGPPAGIPTNGDPVHLIPPGPTRSVPTGWIRSMAAACPSASAH
jgi:hypothetical protein